MPSGLFRSCILEESIYQLRVSSVFVYFILCFFVFLWKNCYNFYANSEDPDLLAMANSAGSGCQSPHGAATDNLSLRYLPMFF